MLDPERDPERERVTEGAGSDGQERAPSSECDPADRPRGEISFYRPGFRTRSPRARPCAPGLDRCDWKQSKTLESAKFADVELRHREGFDPPP
jgi:hypothetical protein